VTVYGLWTGKRWSYWCALSLPILIAVINATFVLLYASAPQPLEIDYSVDLAYTVFSIFWIVVYWKYLRLYPVKAFLNVAQ